MGSLAFEMGKISEKALQEDGHFGSGRFGGWGVAP